METNEDRLMWQCLNELSWIRNHGTPEEQIGLAHTTFEEYIEWRRNNPCEAVREFFKRPDRPQEQIMEEAKLQLMLHIKDQMDKWK